MKATNDASQCVLAGFWSRVLLHCIYTEKKPEVFEIIDDELWEMSLLEKRSTL